MFVMEFLRNPFMFLVMLYLEITKKSISEAALELHRMLEFQRPFDKKAETLFRDIIQEF